MTATQADKAKQFRSLHEAPEAFVIANVWDGGSARMMAALGFPALATSSGASAGLLGRRDGRVTREEALAQARVICDATDLPVSADLEKGFGDAPEVVAETIRLAAEAGLVGCSIEDASGNPDAAIFELSHAMERIAAAAAAARALRPGDPRGGLGRVRSRAFRAGCSAAASTAGTVPTRRRTERYPMCSHHSNLRWYRKRPPHRTQPTTCSRRAIASRRAS